ncbi:MAG: hypothetical protein EPN84_10970 [Legionella sp.]|nr:MAG: hypothetical protein EPN84_10970 [Legionella sp.]
MTNSTEYVLYFNRDKHTREELTYRVSDKNLNYQFFYNDKSIFPCIKHSTSFNREKILTFNTEKQQEEFESALKNNDPRKALKIAKTIELDSAHPNDEIVPTTHPLMFFLMGYIAEQDKINEHNNSFWVRHGLFKKRNTYVLVLEDPEPESLQAN